MRILSIHHAH